MAPPLTLVYTGFKSPHNPYNLSPEAMGALIGSYIYKSPEQPRVLLPSASPLRALISSLKNKGLIEDTCHRYGEEGQPDCDRVVWKLSQLGLKEYERLLEMHLEEDAL